MTLRPASNTMMVMIAQIKKKYPKSLRAYSGEILLVGIDYDKKKKSTHA